jgi:micrococcal nuclease
MSRHLDAQYIFNNLYHYRAKVISIYDGDTITVAIDLGFGNTTKEIVRLARINAPEVRGEERNEGLEARDWLRSVIPPCNNIYVSTNKDRTGKYGRYIAEIYTLEDGNYINLNDELVLAGHAEYREY